MKATVNRGSILDLFEEIRAAFPALRMDLQQEPVHVDLSLDIPKQPGLDFAVSLNLQGDELHLSAASFWLEWFPCTNAEVMARYRDAVHGLISGRYRIVEHCVGTRAAKAQLQRPDGNTWQTIGTSSNWSALISWRKTKRILQNCAR